MEMDLARTRLPSHDCLCLITRSLSNRFNFLLRGKPLMTLLLNLILIALIVCYVVFVTTRYIKKSKQGQCSACEVNKSCSTKQLPKHLQ
ncbi:MULTISPECIES: FeoB-associated Cys-rich membrane protein [Staphylococcus]|nr:FeoB-associated Cys-rich membrane protein [Staphylococcus schleiferi]